MASGDSPAIARRRVRLFLRRAREQRGLTQGQVAEAMEWSLSKVMRIESGEVTIAPNDLRPLLAFLGVTDKATVDGMVQDVRVSRQRRQAWWDEPQFRESLSAQSRLLFQFEADATAIRHFSSVYFPGQLQTADYIAAVLGKYSQELSESDLKVRREARVRRSSDFVRRKDEPRFYALLDQAVLMRQVGGPRVLADQIRSIVESVKRNRVLARVLPFDVDGPLPEGGAYELISLEGDDAQSAVLYREFLTTEWVVEDKQQVADYRELFEQLWAAALADDASIALMQNRLVELEATIRETG